MRVLAATGNTWGISGPTFLGLYAALAVVAVVATVLARRSLVLGLARTRHALDRSPAPGSRLDNPDDVAYLHEGPELTVLAALSAMYVAGRITPSSRGRIQAAGAVGPDASELERAIHLSAQQPVRRAKLVSAPPVAEALRGIERQLIDAGLLLAAEQRRLIRRAGWVLWAVVAVGAIRLIAGAGAGKPVGLLVALTVVVAAGAVLSLTAPRRTHRGDAELTRLRAAHSSLSPRLRPDWHVYGPTGAALGVAVFGAGAVGASNPALAKDLGTSRMAATGYSGADGGGGSGGCGGGGGGGGCGG